MRSRALLILAACVMAILGVGQYMLAPTPPPGAATPAPSPVAASPSPSNSAAPSVGPSSEASVGAAPLVTDFMALYANAPTDPALRADWDARIAALSTPDLAEGLRLTAVERLPRGAVTAISVLEEGDDATALGVELDSGESLTVTVVPTGSGWAVADVQPS